MFAFLIAFLLLVVSSGATIYILSEADGPLEHFEKQGYTPTLLARATVLLSAPSLLVIILAVLLFGMSEETLEDSLAEFWRLISVIWR